MWQKLPDHAETGISTGCQPQWGASDFFPGLLMAVIGQYLESAAPVVAQFGFQSCAFNGAGIAGSKGAVARITYEVDKVIDMEVVEVDVPCP